MGPSSGFAAVLARHAARYPALQPQDAYKLVHQACMGSDHAVTRRVAAYDRLREELARVGGGRDEPLMDPISPAGSVVRVHLRPYVTAGLDADLLAGAFVRTAEEFSPDLDRLRRATVTALELAEAGRLPFAHAALDDVFLRAEASGYAAMHHSEAYREVYRPAYRVVAAAYLPPAIVRAGRARS